MTKLCLKLYVCLPEVMRENIITQRLPNLSDTGPPIIAMIAIGPYMAKPRTPSWNSVTPSSQETAWVMTPGI